MLGQISLFAPDKKNKLRNRISVDIIPLSEARYMLEQFHYLHRTRVGRQINYAIFIDGVVDGVITYAYPMMSAPLLGIPSDEMVEFARLYLHQNIPHTASCAISKSIKRLQKDWGLLYPDAKKIKLIVSWSDATRHKGTVYKASNFEWIRKSGGGHGVNTANSKRGVRKRYKDYGNDKDCWVYWLDSGNREGR